MTVQETKVCNVCNEEKSSDAFYIHNKAKGTRRKDCKECTKKRTAKNTSSPEYFRELHLQKTYGITLEQYDQMLEEQDGGCLSSACRIMHSGISVRYMTV